MLSPAGLLIVSDTLNVCYPLYPDIVNPKEITSLEFPISGRDTEHKMISSEKKLANFILKKSTLLLRICPRNFLKVINFLYNY